MILTKYYANEEDKVQERMSGQEDCNYVGYLKNEKACLAMTGCLGSGDPIDFTILSEHAGDYVNFQWIQEHNAVEGLTNPFTTGEAKSHYVVMDPSFRSDNDTTDNLFPEKNELHEDPMNTELEMVVEEFCFWGWGSCPSLPSSMHMTYRAGYDDYFLKQSQIGSRSKAESVIKAAMTHIQPAYCDRSLGTKISFQREGSIKYYAGTKWEANDLFIMTKNFGFFGREVGNSDTLVLVGSDPTPQDQKWAGIASLGSLCAMMSGWKATINLGYSAQTVAWSVQHEIGHSLGMKHDNDHWDRSCHNGGIMGSKKQGWSKCSKSDFEGHYRSYKWRWCMPQSSSACRGMGR